MVSRPSRRRLISAQAACARYSCEKPFDLVFHGGSGSALEEIREAISYGTVKMNVDTGTRYAFTRPVPVACSPTATYPKPTAGPATRKPATRRSYGKAAEASMTARVTQACQDLLSAGKRPR